MYTAGRIVGGGMPEQNRVTKNNAIVAKRIADALELRMNRSPWLGLSVGTNEFRAETLQPLGEPVSVPVPG